MKYSNLIAVSALLYGTSAMTLKEGFISYPEEEYLQEGEGDLSLNQRKLFAQSLKQTGNNV